MKSLILAAGRGSRMASSTKDAPKCFTTLAGKINSMANRGS